VKIVLFQPQIPQNTGNIMRTCSVTGTSLALVPPLGFTCNDRWLKRSRLDYWKAENIEIFENADIFENTLSTTEAAFYFFSSKAKTSYSELTFSAHSWLIFGSETNGLPESFFQRWPDRFATIPMLPASRCLNLATSVGIVLYEALRQHNFLSLRETESSGNV